MRFLFSVAIGTALLLPAIAAPDKRQAPEKASPKPAKARHAPARQAAPDSVGRVVSIDPRTGELVAVPPPMPAPVASRSASRRGITRGADGSFSAILPDAKELFSVVTVQPDGTITQSHTTAAELEKNGGAPVSTVKKNARKAEGVRR